MVYTYYFTQVYICKEKIHKEIPKLRFWKASKAHSHAKSKYFSHNNLGFIAQFYGQLDVFIYSTPF